MEKNKKIAFTIRLENETKDQLSNIGRELNLPPATVARSYIDLSKYFITSPSLIQKIADGSEILFYPRKLIEFMFNEFNPNEEMQIKIGDEMGRVFLDNCQIMGFHSLSKKIEFLRALGWFRMRIFNDKVGENVRKIWGIKAGIWPLQIVNSMLYRILHIKRFSSQWDIGFIRENLPLSRDEREKRSKDAKKGTKMRDMPTIIADFENSLGALFQNYENGVAYYKFTKLVVEDESE